MIIRGLDTADTGLRYGEIMAEASMTLRHLGFEISERALPRLNRPATTP
jgi:hypothetical protein